MEYDGGISLFTPLTGSIDAMRQRHLDAVDDSDWISSGTFDVFAQIVSSALLFVLIFGLSATVDMAHLREQAHNKFAILTGVCTQFFVMPLLGFAVVKLLRGHGLTEPMAISLLIVTASPGGSYSNWWCSLFNADLALSVTMTAISTMISTVMLPLNLFLYANAAFDTGSEKDREGSIVLDTVNWLSLFISLAIVMLAIGIGLCASVKIDSHRFNKFANRIGSVSGILLIVFSGVVSSLSGSDEAQVWGQSWSFYVGVASPCLAGLALATFFGLVARLKKPEVISVGVECCYQNVGIATTAAVAMFDDPIERGQALCVPLFYGLMEAVVLAIYCIIAWKLGWTKAPSDEHLCVTIITTYEVNDDDADDECADGQIIVDEETQRGIYPSAVNAGPVASTSWWGSRFFGMKSGDVDEAAGNAPVLSPRRMSDTISDSLEAMSQIDAITDLVPFPQKAEYSRCRANSDGTASTAPILETASVVSVNTLDDSTTTHSVL